MVGVPVMVPFALRVRPGGNSDPWLNGCDHVKVPFPPVASSVALYAVPAVPEGSEVVVIVIGVTVNANIFCPKNGEPEERAAWIRNVKVVAAFTLDGVPLNKPVEESVSPGGNFDPVAT